jgi:hypothetical protein
MFYQVIFSSPIQLILQCYLRFSFCQNIRVHHLAVEAFYSVTLIIEQFICPCDCSLALRQLYLRLLLVDFLAAWGGFGAGINY